MRPERWAPCWMRWNTGFSFCLCVFCTWRRAAGGQLKRVPFKQADFQNRRSLRTFKTIDTNTDSLTHTLTYYTHTCATKFRKRCGPVRRAGERRDVCAAERRRVKCRCRWWCAHTHYSMRWWVRVFDAFYLNSYGGAVWKVRCHPPLKVFINEERRLRSSESTHTCMDTYSESHKYSRTLVLKLPAGKCRHVYRHS